MTNAYVDPFFTDGSIHISSKPAEFEALTVGLAALASVLSVDVSGASNLMLHVKNTGTAVMAAGAFAFEGSLDSTDGVNGTWFAIQAVRTNANVVESASGTLALAVGAGVTYGWELSVNALRWVRIRCSTAVTASSIATWTAVRGSYATEPIPATQTHAVTGSGTFTVAGTASILPGAGTNYGLIGAATINAAVVKAAAGALAEITVFNPTAAVVYAKLYNKATTPAPATDSALLLCVVPVPVNAFVPVSFGTAGKRFAAGIGLAIVGLPANTDATAVAAGVVVSATYV